MTRTPQQETGDQNANKEPRQNLPGESLALVEPVSQFVLRSAPQYRQADQPHDGGNLGLCRKEQRCCPGQKRRHCYLPPVCTEPGPEHDRKQCFVAIHIGFPFCFNLWPAATQQQIRVRTRSCLRALPLLPTKKKSVHISGNCTLLHQAQSGAFPDRPGQG